MLRRSAPILIASAFFLVGVAASRPAAGQG
jgi:hypothetical protein